jgi:hypothetical protein
VRTALSGRDRESVDHLELVMFSGTISIFVQDDNQL